MTRRSVLALILILGLVRPAAARAAQPADPVAAALAWLKAQQRADGGFSNGFTPESDLSTTADVVLAVAGARADPKAWVADGRTPLDFLAAAASSGGVKGPGVAAKLALAVQAVGLRPSAFGGVDLIAAMRQGYDPKTGLFGGGPFDSALCILALQTAGEPLPEGAVQGLVSRRLQDGSYAFNGDLTPGAGDSNTTAVVVRALVAAKAADQTKPSLDYFRAAQNADGGWTYQKPSAYGEATDTNSTALVIQALLEAGQDLQAWGNPRQALLALQVSSGAFIFTAPNSAENLLATVQAIPALVASEPGGAAARSPVDARLLGGVLGLLVVLLAAAGVIAVRRR